MLKIKLDPTYRVLATLSGGQHLERQELASRAEISVEQLAAIESLLASSGVPLHSSPTHLTLAELQTHQPLDAQMLKAALAPSVVQRTEVIQLSAVCHSTNDELDTLGDLSANRFNVALSDAQTGGRGRQGHQWISPFAGGIYLSVATLWLPTEQSAEKLPSNLPLAIGVSLAEQLQTLVTEAVMLKWPNDLIAKDRKLGGLLLESRAHSAGGYCLKIGIGLNLLTPDLSADESRVVAAIPPIGLRALATDKALPKRSAVAAMVLNAAVLAIDEYREKGFAPFQSRWQKLDYLFERPIAMHSPLVDSKGHADRGIAVGINADGALRVNTEQGELVLSGGEVSVRRS